MATDAFALLGLPAEYEHPPRTIRQHFMRAQAQVQAQGGDSTAINRAYDLVKDPVQRAHLLLQQRGITVQRNSTRQVPHTVLAQHFDQQERLESTRHEPELLALQAHADKNKAQHERAFVDALAAEDPQACVASYFGLLYAYKLCDLVRERLLSCSP